MSKLGDDHSIILDLVYKAMLVGDPPRPISGEAMFERLGFTLALVRRPFNLTDEGVDPFYNFFVGVLPVQIVVPGVF
jgi:hypothetical protein